MMDDAVALTYGPMSRAAVRQAEFRRIQEGTLRSGPDVCGAARWRVPVLVSESHLLLLLGAFVLDAGALMVRARNPEVSVPFWIYLLPLLTVVAAGMAVFGSLRAWRLARVARRAASRRGRYALLHSYVSGMPWLVFFPESGGNDAEPFGALPLRYGPKHDLFRGLPRPVGHVDLCGLMRSGETVVPWIGDRPV